MTIELREKVQNCMKELQELEEAGIELSIMKKGKLMHIGLVDNNAASPSDYIVAYKLSNKFADVTE